MPHRLVISSILEYLGAGPSAADSGIFGLALSVGVDAPLPPDADVRAAARWACPWLWQLMTPDAVAIAAIDANGARRLSGTSVTLFGVHATNEHPPERDTLIA